MTRKIYKHRSTCSTNLVNSSILDAINYPLGNLPTPRSAKNSAPTLMDVVNYFRRQINGITAVEALVPSLSIGSNADIVGI